jgi:cytochrome bd-type quinol oxidase subunit 2
MISTLALTIIGSVWLLIKKDQLQRHVKATYMVEFYYLVAITVFGLLGIVVLFDYLGGNRQYIANILILLVAVFVYILLRLGRKFFNFDYRKKK